MNTINEILDFLIFFSVIIFIEKKANEKIKFLFLFIYIWFSLLDVEVHSLPLK